MSIFDAVKESVKGKLAERKEEREYNNQQAKISRDAAKKAYWKAKVEEEKEYAKVKAKEETKAKTKKLKESFKPKAQQSSSENWNGIGINTEPEFKEGFLFGEQK